MTAGKKRHLSSVSLTLKKLWQSKKKLLITASASLIAAITAYVTQEFSLTNVTSYVADYYKRYQYVHYTLKRPYETLLAEKDVTTWDPGQAQLAIFQIQGYLGQLRTGTHWIKQCLTNPAIFPNAQFNDRFEISPSDIDRQNLAILQRRIDAADLQRDYLLRTTDVFQRLLERSSTQLLYRYYDNEISKLDPAALYLLRNAIFARRGRSFDSEKLEKYANRNRWPSSLFFQWSQVPPVELCNALYLNELHAANDRGALGRGILIRNNYPVPATRILKASLCSCLNEPKVMVSCRNSSDASNQDEFRDFVDLVLQFDVADKNRVDWTFLDPRNVASVDLADFTTHADSFLASSVEFNSGIQSVLQTHNFPFAISSESEQEAFWGTRVSFTETTYNALASDARFLRELSTNMCATLHDALEVSGQHVPRLKNESVAVLPGTDLKIFQMPIVFDDLRMKLTLEYIQKHYGDKIYGESVSDINLRPRMIVLHRTNIETLDGSYEALRPATLPEPEQSAPDPTKTKLNSSVHYLVDKEGNIYSLMRDFYMARHVVGLDEIALGISNVGASESSMTNAQLRADELLIRFLAERNNNIKWLIAASEAANFKGSGLWEELDDKYSEPNFDPGTEFMGRLRKQLQKDKLNLASKPNP
jgi:N-acetylmuramoyl-L-alanine amidase